MADRHRIQPKIRTAASRDNGRNLASVDCSCQYYLLSLRALELAGERVKETCKGDDVTAAAIEAHFALHAVYILHEAYFQPRGIGGMAAKEKILAATGGQSVGTLSLYHLGHIPPYVRAAARAPR